MNTRVRFSLLVSGAILFGAIFSAGKSKAEADPSLTQIFDAVCLKPADAASREAAARALGLRRTPKSFSDKPPSIRGATVELNLWKALDGQMLLLHSLTGTSLGPNDLPAIICQAVVSPGDPDVLADAGKVLGLALTDGTTTQTVAFIEGPAGRKMVNIDDDAAMDAAMRSGGLRTVYIQRSGPRGDTDLIMVTRPLQC